MIKLPLKDVLQIVKLGLRTEDKRIEIMDASTGEIYASFEYLDNEFIQNAFSYYTYYVVKIEINDIVTTLCVERN